jgi:hypothetical protein
MTLPGLNNVTTADDYTSATTLETPGAVAIRLSIANAAIYYSQRDRLDAAAGMRGQSIPWGPEVFAEPSYLTIRGPIDGIRVRSAVAGTPAQVTATPR